MTSKAGRLQAVLVLMLAACAVASAAMWRPTEKLADMRPKIELEQLFPKVFGDWHVDTRQPVQLVSPDQQAAINKLYNQVLSRTYVNGQGQRVMLSIAYGGDQTDATRAHRPEVCYPAQGFQILRAENSAVQLPDRQLPLRQLVARQGGRNEPISYWITVGEQTTLTGMQQKLAQLSYSTRGIVPDGMLVRVSSIDASDASAWALQRQFILAMAQALAPAQRALVVGKPDA